MKLNGAMINPGELNTQITLQKPTIGKAAGGAQVVTWSTLATIWARWTNVHGSEVWQSQAVQAINPATVLIRYRSDVTTACSILKGSTLFEIVSIDNILERNEYLGLKVKSMKGSV
jgi:SPP1 family predicted phage head-tail adaptor